MLGLPLASACLSRSPYGERGLKFVLAGKGAFIGRRSPHGERGLKFDGQGELALDAGSLPSREAWIEIICGSWKLRRAMVAPLTGSVD